MVESQNKPIIWNMTEEYLLELLRKAHEPDCDVEMLYLEEYTNADIKEVEDGGLEA